MQFLDELPRQRAVAPVDHHVDAAEVVGGLDDVAHVDAFIVDAGGLVSKMSRV